MKESSGVASGLTSLPSGGGGIAPLGEKFQPDLVKGTGNYAIPINLPKGPNETCPSLSLTYSTGAGNGAFGFGWRMNLIHIERQTDRGVPTYTDEDTFVFSAAEALINIGGNKYRPKTDNKFWQIEKTDNGWKVMHGNGKTWLLGSTEQSREINGASIFAWFLDEEIDAAGNSIKYKYKRDNNKLYLEEIQYSIFTVKIEYETRFDSLRNGRAGFEKITALRGKTINLHCDKPQDTIIKTFDLEYDQGLNGASLLKKFKLSATEGGTTANFPELTFNYSDLNLEKWKVHEILAEISPSDLDEGTQLVDMTGDGLPDVLKSTENGALLWQNSGNGYLDGPNVLEALPSTLNLSKPNVAFADLNGNGRVDLFAIDQPLQLAFENNGKGGFDAAPVVFENKPNLRLSEGNTRLVDLNGDGVTDLLSSGLTHFLLYNHIPGKGWQDPQAVKRINDLDIFPDLDLADPNVKLTDFTGDGFQDFAHITSGNVSYWPYLGNGNWGNRVEMENSPVFPTGYRESRLHVADIDGDGCSDLVYFDYDKTLIYINQSGLRFGQPIEIPVTPITTTSVHATDFMGDGKLGFIWSATRTVENSAGYRYLRFDEGKKPYLLNTITNGLGGIFEMEYTSHIQQQNTDSVVDFLNKIPFPVQVVKTIREKDLITNRSTEYSMKYSEGVYDGPLREFRGFSHVIVDTLGDEYAPTTRQEIRFYQGHPELNDLVERNRQRALAGSMLNLKIFELANNTYILKKESHQNWETRLEFDNVSDQIYFPFLSEIHTIEYSLDAATNKIERTKFQEYDDYGNTKKTLRESFAEGAPVADFIHVEEKISYVENVDNWLVKIPSRAELIDKEGKPFAVKINYYDGADFIGLPEGQAEKGLLTRTQELKLTESKLPAGYIGDRDFASLGYELTGTGESRGYYVTSFSVKRDEKGNIVAQNDPLGKQVTIAYDVDFLYPNKSTDSRGKETFFTFNPRSGEPLLTSYPDGRITRQEFDPLGRLVANYETDQAGVERLIKCWIADFSVVPTSLLSIAPNQSHTKAELLASFDTLATVSLSKVYYDGFGKETQQISSVNAIANGDKRFVVTGRCKINKKGLTSIKYPAAFVPNLNFTEPPLPDDGCVKQRYDYNGNIVETLGPSPAHFKIVRNTFTIDHYEGINAGEFGDIPVGNPSRREFFDAHGRLIKIEENKGDGTTINTSYELTIDGKIKTIKENEEVVTQFTFAGPAESIMINHRDIGTRTYYRDANSNIIERKSPDGSILFNTYDDLKRLVKIEHESLPNSPKVKLREIFYDNDPLAPSAGRFLEGKIALLKEGTNEFRFSYSSSGKVLKEEVTTNGITLTTHREYDVQGRSTAIVYPDGKRVEYVMDVNGVVNNIPGYMSDAIYAADGNAEGYTLANGVEVLMPRDALSRRLNSVSATKSGAVLRKIDYTYDEIGNIINLQDEMPGSVENNSFTYDGLYRLGGFITRATDNAGAILKSGNYSYDASGNILQFGDTQPITLAYGDNTFKGRTTSVQNGPEDMPITYDGNGHIKSLGDLETIEFDPLDRLVRVVKKDATEIRFAYDAQGRRVHKQVTKDGVTKHVRYATGLYEQHDDYSISNIFFGNLVIASGKVSAVAPDLKKVFYLNDHHGTVLTGLDETGAIIHNQRYSPFGATLNNADVLDRYLGKEKDIETGLIQMGARYYAPILGRFISPDWYILENPNKPMRMPQGYNVYGYALNNPLVFKDPSGMWFGIDDLIVAAVGFVVGFVGGLIYGLANGQGWDSFLTALETGLTTAAGAWLGWNTTGVFGLVNGGFNGFMGGIHGIYDWSSADGWFAFISDSTWGIIGTTMGNVVHVINLFGSTGYRDDLSRRQNRHVYEGGAYLKDGFAFTMGNVISNAGQNGRGVNASFIANHEELHVWQNRFFGPIFQTTYVVWAVGGFVVGSIYWLFNTNENYGSVIETTVYYDNPFEYWAYENDNNWPPGGANRNLTY
jgi:RHS repeat-associated protein